MIREEILKKVAKITADILGLDADDVKPESRFIMDLQADSLDAVEIVQQVEDKFGLGTLDTDGIETVEQLTDIVNAELEKKS